MSYRPTKPDRVRNRLADVRVDYSAEPTYALNMLQADEPPDIQRLYAKAAWEIVADPVERPSPAERLHGVGSFRFGSTAGYVFDHLRYREVAAASTTALGRPAEFSPAVCYVGSSGWANLALTEPTFELQQSTSTGGWETL